MNDLEKYFENNDKRLIDKWMHYFEVYDRHFSKYRGKEVVILEIGISQGGSLQMWKDYFGDKAKIYGIDINPKCKDFEEKNIEIFIGSQSDRNFLQNVKEKIPKVDIFIDDGGHTMQQLIVSYQELFGHIKEDGVYLAEDLHTSYWLEYGGGHKRRGTFIEYSKNFIDQLHGFHSEQSSLNVSEFTSSVNSIHYYDSILVVEKRKRAKPFSCTTGTASFVIENSKRTKADRFMRDVKKGQNKLLRFFNLGGSDLFNS
ncbi:class I SAM-dependent methyltransferase [Winogradskyella forsetii]|uniref:class I SAM-dependent methyltransferase n=1 Tax=Winogradskyella forsetii TaxID=2686077 RepID=UPI0015BCF1BB|nr:class I SAM-dependent methyltransferase [Winogradskyella forsetii]